MAVLSPTSPIYRAELSCLSCGYEVGDVEGRRSAPLSELTFLPVHQGDALHVDNRGQFQCPRCHGRVLPHGVSRVNRPIDPGTLYEGDLRDEVRPRTSF